MQQATPPARLLVLIADGNRLRERDQHIPQALSDITRCVYAGIRHASNAALAVAITPYSTYL